MGRGGAGQNGGGHDSRRPRPTALNSVQDLDETSVEERNFPGSASHQRRSRGRGLPTSAARGTGAARPACPARGSRSRIAAFHRPYTSSSLVPFLVGAVGLIVVVVVPTRTHGCVMPWGGNFVEAGLSPGSGDVPYIEARAGEGNLHKSSRTAAAPSRTLPRPCLSPALHMRRRHIDEIMRRVAHERSARDRGCWGTTSVAAAR